MSEGVFTQDAEPKGTESRSAKEKQSGIRKAKKIVLIVLLVLFAVTVILIGKFIYDINHPAQLFDVAPAAASTTPSPTAAEPTVEPVNVGDSRDDYTPAPTQNPEAALLSQADINFMKNRVNVLLLGLDESTERANWGSFRTDTMILVTIDFDTNDVDMISIPRDSYVKLCSGGGAPTGKYGKVNSAFPSGGGAQKNGYEYAMGTVSYLLGGIPINYYVGFNMNVVKDVVNAMGGVYYNVDIDVKMNGRELHPGMQFMDGQAVLDYCRQRKGSSDIERVDRQQRILVEIFKQMKSTGQIANIPSIYQAVEQNIQTNLTLTQISSLALLATRMKLDQLGRHMVEGEFMNIYKVSYWGVHTNKVQSMVQKVFGVSVNVDSDISAGNVRARVEENRALIATELNAAHRAINTADGIINNYANSISADVLKNLKTAKSLLEDAYDAENKEQLDKYTPQLEQWNNYAMSLLGISSGSEPSQDYIDAGEEEIFDNGYPG